MNDLKPNKHYIISAKPDGLGMRLASILIGMYLAKKVDFIFAFTWSKSIDLDKYDVRTKKLKDLHYHANEMEHVESIFSKEFIAKYMIEKDFENSHGFLIAKNKKLNNIKLGKFEKKWGWYSTDLPPWIWLKDCLKSDCLNEIKNIYCNLDFSHNFKQIINDVNILAKELNNFTSIHIRGGDIIYSPLRKNAGWKVLEERYFPYEIAMEIIQESLLFGEKVVIFGQDIIANNILIKYFRDRQFKNIFLVDEIIKSKYTNFERAFFEINLMSKSNKIYAPKVSAFSRVSMLISGTDNLIPYDKKFSIKELHSIMLKNIGRLELHSLQLSRSYFYLYLLQKQINPVFSKLFLYLKKSSRLDKDND
ncbi:TPA: sugar transferase, partial [Campylobacter jejuni]|nr:sugar transferase [Campylobacter jejuni]